VLEGVIFLETFPLVEWHYGEPADVQSFTVLKTQICVTRQQCVKDTVFSTPVPAITNLKARIADAFATITEDMENTWREIDYRLEVLRATKEAHVEVY